MWFCMVHYRGSAKYSSIAELSKNNAIRSHHPHFHPHPHGGCLQVLGLVWVAFDHTDPRYRLAARHEVLRHRRRELGAHDAVVQRYVDVRACRVLQASWCREHPAYRLASNSVLHAVLRTNVMRSPSRRSAVIGSSQGRARVCACGVASYLHSRPHCCEMWLHSIFRVLGRCSVCCTGSDPSQETPPGPAAYL